MRGEIRQDVLFAVTGQPGVSTVRADVLWWADHPHAVTLRFPADVCERPDEPDWVFARDLLAEGLNGPVGIGDVRVRPEPPNRVVIELRGPDYDGSAAGARLSCRASVVCGFLKSTYAIVPAGEESARIAWDEELARLLHSGGLR